MEPKQDQQDPRENGALKVIEHGISFLTHFHIKIKRYQNLNQSKSTQDSNACFFRIGILYCSNHIHHNLSLHPKRFRSTH